MSHSSRRSRLLLLALTITGLAMLAAPAFAAAPPSLLRGASAHSGAVVGAADNSSPATRSNGNVNPGLLPPQGLAFGKTYGDWGAAWWAWALSIPFGSNPIFDPTGADQAQNQSGPVWFLAGNTGGSSERSVTLPAGKAIFLPLINIENDYPCPDPTFQPAPGQSLFDFLKQGATALIEGHVDELDAALDDRTFANLFAYRGTSSLQTFTGDLSLTSTYDPCITGTPQPFVSDGYWLLLKPLTPGRHTLSFSVSAFGGGFTIDMLYHLNVTNGRTASALGTAGREGSAPAGSGSTWGRLKMLYR